MAEYQPVSWVKWVRLAQLVLSIVIIALGAYAASQTWVCTTLHIKSIHFISLTNKTDSLWRFIFDMGSRSHLPTSHEQPC